MKKCISTLFLAAIIAVAMNVVVFAAEAPIPDQIGEAALTMDGATLGASDAATATSSLPKAQKKAITKLTNMGEYWGWTNTVGSPHKNGKVYITLSNSTYIFGDIAVSKKGKYTFKGTKFTFAGFKDSLKQYSSAADRKALLKSKAEKAGNSLEKYATTRSWKTTASKSYKSGKAKASLVFNNLNYGFKVVVTAVRKSGKIALSYKFDKKSVTLKYIKETLEKYKDKVATITEPKPVTPSYGTSGDDLDLNASASLPEEISEYEVLGDDNSNEELVLSDLPVGEGIELISDHINF